VPRRPARSIVYLALGNVPGRGRSPWDIAVQEALIECARDAGEPPAGCSYRFSATSPALSLCMSRLIAIPHWSPISSTAGRWALGAERHAVQVADSVKRDRERQQLEHALQVFVASASSDELSLFGEAFQAFAVGFQRRFGPLPDDQRSEVKD